MKPAHNIRISDQVLAATINEGLEKRHIHLRKNGKAAIEIASASALPDASECKFSFIQAETKMDATLSYDQKSGVIITVVLNGAVKNEPFEGAVVGRLLPAWPGQDAKDLVLQYGEFCCNAVMSKALFEINHVHPSGYSLRRY